MIVSINAICLGDFGDTILSDVTRNRRGTITSIFGFALLQWERLSFTN